tara:strand:+ start:190 stop:468 length:279 start_codon:yes stop_codon:yes gene_type:complete
MNDSKILELADSLTSDKDKETHMKEYITSVKALEDAMEPFKEQKRELRKEYDDNGWLNKDEQRMVVRAYRLLKDDIDIGELIDMYDALRGAK